MPLIKRCIEPTNLSRTHVAPGVQNELECVTNSTLANVIRQLSSLSKYAEDMFSELSRDANTFFHRANQLTERVDRLKVKVTQLDSTGEEVSLQDIHMRKPFKSSTKKDQQIITLLSRPEAIAEIYAQCDAPPPLDKLNPYREDGKDSRKFYTDPTYFFELWCREMQKDTEQTKKELSKRKHKKRPKQQRGPAQVREAHNRLKEMQKLKDGVEFVPPQPQQQYLPQQQPGVPPGQHTMNSPQYGPGDRSPRPNSLELSNHNHYLASMQNAPNGQPQTYDPNYAQHGEVPPPYSQYNDSTGMRNGPIDQNWDGTGYQDNKNVPQYNAPPPYNHNHNVDQYSGYEGQYNNNTKQYDSEPIERTLSPQHTPSKSRVTTPGSRGSSSAAVSPRPSAPPPAPPGLQNSPMGASRESLPPPPPPPPLDGAPMPNHMAGSKATPPFGSPSHMHSIRDSPGRHNTPSPQLSTTKSSTPDSIDMPPPPPPPPLMSTPDNPHSMPPPPPTPPPPEPQELSTLKEASPGHPRGAPAPPPAPPLPAEGVPMRHKLPNGDLGHGLGSNQPDAVSIASNASSNTVSSSGTNKSDDKAPIRDTRCDLLAAIREGIKLRKVEEQRHKQEQKKHPTSTIDVQSIMEAAFEMRRKALEANDDSEEEEEQEGEWSDDD